MLYFNRKKIIKNNFFFSYDSFLKKNKIIYDKDTNNYSIFSL